MKRYRDDLADEIHDAAASIADEVRKENRKDAFEYASYKLSKKMCTFIQAIRRLGYMDGGLENAFHLVVGLGMHSFVKEPGMFGGYNLRDSDSLADALLVEPAKKPKAEVPKFEFSVQLKVIREQGAWLADRGISTFFPRGSKLLSS